MNQPTALIVEDDPDFRASISLLVSREGFAVEETGSLKGAREHLEKTLVDVVLLDLSLPDGEGLELIADPGERPDCEFVIMTGSAEADTAIAALRYGALDYLKKPVDRARLKSILTNVSRTRGLKRQVSNLRGELRELGRFGQMVGRSEPMQRVYDLIARVAPTSSTVFVTGESGTGKELVADTVHQLSERSDEPFIALNCGAIAPTLIESELFGHEKGSFSGADSQRQGYFEKANGGTLFLDEVTEMPLELQVKLLRVLETGTITRVGSSESIPVDVRVVAASNRDPKVAVDEGHLREDLLYRLNVFPIELPPLRDRGDDVVALAQVFLDRLNAREGTSCRISDAGKAHLLALPWPGNVRELSNVIERAAILADDSIGPEVLPEGDGAAATADPDSSGTQAKLAVRVGSSIEDVERRLILATLEEFDGDKKRAAKVLGIGLKTLYNRLKVYAAQDGA